MLKRTLIAGLGILVAGTAWAADERPMPYSEFAQKIPHVRLTVCPAIVVAESADCHVAVIENRLHVFAFARTDDRHMVSVHSEPGGQDGDDFRLSMRN